MNDDLIGKSLGQFEIIEEVGRGGMASVYRARQTSINRIVAIKVLPKSLLHDPSFYERFTREVALVAHLEHPHILPIHDYGEVDGTPYIAMRYLAGGSMAEWIRRGLPPLDKLAKPVEQVSSALDYAHQEGVIHRDLKPGNVLLDENGNAYLSDFGIARVLDSNLTGSAIIGTPAYMSPEQANGLPLDARSDIYSLGVVLYELVTGREPFEAVPVGARRGERLQHDRAVGTRFDLVGDVAQNPPAVAGADVASLVPDPEAQRAGDADAELLVVVAVLGNDTARRQLDQGHGHPLALDDPPDHALPDLHGLGVGEVGEGAHAAHRVARRSRLQAFNQPAALPI